MAVNGKWGLFRRIPGDKINRLATRQFLSRELINNFLAREENGGASLPEFGSIVWNQRKCRWHEFGRSHKVREFVP